MPGTPHLCLVWNFHGAACWALFIRRISLLHTVFKKQNRCQVPMLQGGDTEFLPVRSDPILEVGAGKRPLQPRVTLAPLLSSPRKRQRLGRLRRSRSGQSRLSEHGRAILCFSRRQRCGRVSVRRGPGVSQLPFCFLECGDRDLHSRWPHWLQCCLWLIA